MIVLGIDPGIALTGWGVIEAQTRDKIKSIQYGCITTISSQPIIERIQSISVQLQKIIDIYQPQNIAIEELFFLKRASSIALIGQARGAILLTIAQNKIKLYEYNPRRVKIALTGYGSADKQQMQRMVKDFLGLTEIPKPDDAADALAMAICHIHTVGVNKI
ncbi:MAG: crossover junction endodeoxyribonuclease RuvC [Elusimicrobiota bacterium]|jgi:crossover junction endodeoxyribonuclease RuvC|nr:crossover junction endodeoxyribonuclease RuvC [Elusimicrobiota bacterium]